MVSRSNLIKAKDYNRIYWLDISRAIFIAGMICYHFYWDLRYFHLVITNPFYEHLSSAFAHIIASGFLFITGFSLTISFNDRPLNIGFYRRLFKISIAAILTTYVSYRIFPQDFIYFGILHEIVFSSIIVAILKETPFFIDGLLSFAIVCASYLALPALPYVNLWPYLGLSRDIQASVDFVPIFPWTALPLLGSAAAKLYRNQKRNKTKTAPSSNTSTLINILNKYSLAIYLLHQPILFGMMLYYNIHKTDSTFSNQFIESCQAECQISKNRNFCQKYCRCMKYNFSQPSIANSDKKLYRSTRICIKESQKIL